MSRLFDTSDKSARETWGEYWGRKHDERHGPACECAWNRAGRIGARLTLPGIELDTVPRGKRVVLWRSVPTGQEASE